MAGEDVQRVGPFEVALFLDELVLLVVLGIAGARLVDGTGLSIALAALLPLAAAVIWGLWLAPRASRRLGHGVRLVAKLALVAAASLLLTSAGLPWWSLAFFVISAALMTRGEM